MSRGKATRPTTGLSIQATLLLAFLAISIVLSCALCGASLVSGYRNGLRQATEHLISVADIKDSQLTVWGDALVADMESVLPQGPLLDAAKDLLTLPPENTTTLARRTMLNQHFTTLAHLSERFKELCMLAPSGQILASSQQDGDCAFRKLPTPLGEPQPPARTVLWFKPLDEKGFTAVAAKPITSIEGDVLGTLAGVADLSQVDRLMAEGCGLGKTGRTFLLGDDPVLLPPSQRADATASRQIKASYGATQAWVTRQNGHAIYTGVHGREVIGVWRWLPSLNAVLLAEQDLSEALEPLYASLWVNVATAAACMLLAVLAAGPLSRRLATPLSGLAEAARHIAQGQLNFRVPVSGQAEVRALAESFNLMAGRLMQRTGAETLLGEIARLLLSAPPGGESDSPRMVLERLGRFCGADCVTLSILGPDGVPVAIEQWSDAMPHGQTRMCARFENAGTDTPKPQSPIVLADVSQSGNPSFANLQGAVAWTPLDKEGLPWGFLCMESLSPQSWDDGILRLLSLAGEILGMSMERARAQKAQAQAESNYRSLFDNAAEAILQTTPEGRVLTANPAAARMFGYATPGEMIDSVTDISAQHYAKPARREEFLALLRTQGQVRGFETLFSHKSGRLTWISINAKGSFDPAGNLTRIDVMAEDVTARKVSEAEREQLLTTLAQKNAELAKAQSTIINVIDSMPSALVSVDETLRITQINREAARLTGKTREAALGRPLAEALPQLASRQGDVAKAIRMRTPVVHRHQPEGSGGALRYCDTIIYPLLEGATRGAVLRVDDVTERVRIEEMMVQTEKMLSVGGLAAGMAHEINNPLAGILQSAQNILRRLSPELDVNRKAAKAAGCDLDTIRSYLESREIMSFVEAIKSSGERAAKIVANMLEFTRRSTSNLLPVDLHAVLEQALELAASDYDLTADFDFKHIEIIRDFDPGLPPIPCSTSQIQQVVLNLLRNAAQAMAAMTSSSHKPRITIRTRAEAGFAVIQLADNGPGMEEDSRRRVFEPFFTTKGVGQGTGLGLSVSYFLITQNHHGELSVESRPGKGTCFTIRLPLKSPPSQ